MKLIVLTTCNNIIDGQQKPLEDSLIKHGYDYEIFLYGFIFGEQYKVIRTWVEQYKGDATHVLYTDCWDTLALAPPEEVLSKWIAMELNDAIEIVTNPYREKKTIKMLISAEKAYFPDNGQSHLYPESLTPWKYINGGGCLFEIEFFKNITTPYPDPMMDPYWLRDIFLQYPNEVKLDYHCEIFQTLAHSSKDEWEVIKPTTNPPTIDTMEQEGYRIWNKATRTEPIFIHGNGHTDMQWIYDIATKQAI